jgi:hypothetical protein
MLTMTPEQMQAARLQAMCETIAIPPADAMTIEQMKVALGVLTDAMAEAAFGGGGSLDGCDCQELLVKAGLTYVRPATEEDIENSEYGDFAEPGDDWHALTPFAIECRDLATKQSKASKE